MSGFFFVFEIARGERRILRTTDDTVCALTVRVGIGLRDDIVPGRESGFAATAPMDFAAREPTSEVREDYQGYQ